MSPKQKADELVDKYLNNSFGIVKEYIPAPLPFAKECALIAVNEIMKAIPDASDDDSPYNHELVYWKEVKQEIENL